MTSLPRFHALGLLLAVVLVSGRVTAEPAAAPRAIDLEFSCDACDLDAAKVRSAVLAEAGVSGGQRGPGVPVLRLVVDGRRLVARYEADGHPTLERTMSLPEDRERAIQAIALLSANLVRDEAEELLEGLRPRPATMDVPPPPDAPAASSATTPRDVAPPPTKAEAKPPEPPAKQEAKTVDGPPAEPSDAGKYGRVQAVVWGTTHWPGSVGIRYLYANVYALLGAGYKPAEVDRVAWQLAVGGHVPFGVFFLDGDVGYAHEGQAAQGNGIEHTQVFRYRAMIGWQPARAIGVFVGGGIGHEFPAHGESSTRPEALAGVQVF